LIVRKPI